MVEVNLESDECLDETTLTGRVVTRPPKRSGAERNGMGTAQWGVWLSRRGKSPQWALLSLDSPFNECPQNLKSQGLVSVRDIWIAFHYPAANQSGIRGASR